MVKLGEIRKPTYKNLLTLEQIIFEHLITQRWSWPDALFYCVFMSEHCKGQNSGEPGMDTAGQVHSMSQVQGQARMHHKGWSLPWWSPQAGLWGDGDQPCWDTAGAEADGSGGLAWAPGLWEVWQAPEGGQGWSELVVPSGL